MTDEELDALVEYLRGKAFISQREADAITSLRTQLAEVQAERDRWIEHTKVAVWSDSEELTLANARADRAEAERAAQIERDAGIALKHRNNLNALTSLPPQSAAAWNIYNEIRAQAHDRSALDAMIAEARAQALREAVNEINCGCRIEEGGCVFPHACPQEDVSAILALIEKPDAT